MADWFNNLSVFLQILFVLGCTSTVIMFIQLILLIVGFDGGDNSFDGDVDLDGPADDFINDGGFLDIFGLRILTVRNLFIFIAMFSWVTLLLYEWVELYWVAILVGFVFAFVVVVIVAYVMKQAMRLQDEGTVRIENAVGKRGSCYLTIPAKKSGLGKVNVLVQERLYEFEAYTDDDDQIPTGVEIVAVGTLGNALIVRRVKENLE